MPKGTEAEAQKLKGEISSYQDLRFWKFVFGEPNDIKRLFFSLKKESATMANSGSKTRVRVKRRIPRIADLASLLKFIYYF